MNPPPESCTDKPTASRKQAAVFLGKTIDTLGRWDRRPDRMGLPCHRRANGEIFYYWDHLRRWRMGEAVICDCEECELRREEGVSAKHLESLPHESG